MGEESCVWRYTRAPIVYLLFRWVSTCFFSKKSKMFELFRHPWFKNWGHVIDIDAKKVFEELKDVKSPYVKTLRELLEHTMGSVRFSFFPRVEEF